jgi:hypothetical protein
MMKKLLLAACAGFVLSTTAFAADQFRDVDVAYAKQVKSAKNLSEVPFFMKGESHPAVAKSLGTFTSNKRTNAFWKSKQKACSVAYLSAVISLQNRAISEGADAVVDIISVTKHNNLESAEQFRCIHGTAVANVALTGRMVKYKK